MAEQLDRNDYWSIVLLQLKKSKLGLLGLAIIFLLYIVAVFSPFLAESKPIKYVHVNSEDRPCAICRALGESRVILTLADGRKIEGRILKQDTEMILFAHYPDNHQETINRKEQKPKLEFTPKGHGPIVMWPLLRSLDKTDIYLLLSFACLVMGTPVYFQFRRRLSRKAGFFATLAVLSPVIIATVVLIYTRHEDRVKMELGPAQDLFGSLRKGDRLGPEDKAVWPLVRYNPMEIHKSVSDVSKPPFMDREPHEIDRAKEFAGEGDWQAIVRTHPLGTDNQRRDVLARMIHGSRISLSVGFFSVAIYVTVGVILGALAGFYGGKIDALIMRLTEVVMCFPTLFLIITILALVQPSLWWVMATIAVVGWTTVARLVRAEFLKLRKQDFVSSARALGARHGRIIFRHILPNALSPVFVSATFGIAGAILTESALSFLGIGVPVDAPTWGNILRVGREVLSEDANAWWLAMFPGVAIFVTVTAFNLFGESLRDAMDPRLKGGH